MIHGAVAFGPYRDLFKNQIFPSAQVGFLEIYNASEGFFGIQDDLSKPDEMLLMLDYGIFYEFIPMNEEGEEASTIVSLGQVEVGVNYAMVISTNSKVIMSFPPIMWHSSSASFETGMNLLRALVVPEDFEYQLIGVSHKMFCSPCIIRSMYGKISS